MDDSGRWNLRVRMVVVLVALLAAGAVFFGGLYVVYLLVLPALVRPFAEAWAFHETMGVAAVGFLALLVFVPAYVTYAELRESGAIHADTTRATAESHPTLVATADRLAARAGLPRPALRVAPVDAPVAYTTGLRKASATIVVTTGLLETCSDEQLEVVIAHELAHVDHRDGALLYAAHVLPSLTYAIANALYAGLVPDPDDTGSVHVGRSRRPEGATQAYSGRSIGTTQSPLSSAPVHRSFTHQAAWWIAVQLLRVLVLFVAVLTALLAGVIWVASTLVLLLLARTREFTADRYAARLVGDPAVVADALQTLDDELAATPDADLRLVDGGLESLYVIGLDADWFDGNAGHLAMSDLFPASHPPTEARVERLLALADG